MKRNHALARLLSGLALLTGLAAAENSTYLNPVLPGWHSDPSCISLDRDHPFFASPSSPYAPDEVPPALFLCATSTFIAFPGLPVYASHDLVHHKLISHAWHRESQIPGLSWNTWGQQDGFYAPTLRYHDGLFYLICEYLGQSDGIVGVVFTTENPFEPGSWSDPVTFSPDKIDPDLYWDACGRAWMASQGIILQRLDLETGALGEPVELWNGTGGVWPEGPHIYRRFGYYYLLIAEGGTATDHAITMARSRSITGPYEPSPHNPHLTNRGTDAYFQTVGHGDLFQDGDGNWWGTALATRSGPAYNTYPMGRETVLFPVTWEEDVNDGWPIMEPVRGRMSGWPLPPADRHVPGTGPFNDAADDYSFQEGDAALPPHFLHWRVPRDGAFTPTAAGLEVVPSRANLTGEPSSDVLSGRRGLAFVGRRQTHTLFEFSVDLAFSPAAEGEEAGVAVFLTQFNHVELGVGAFDEEGCRGGGKCLRFHAEGTGAAPVTAFHPLALASDTLRLGVRAANETHFDVLVGAPDDKEGRVVGSAAASLLSGGTGSFVGSLVGVYATCGGNGGDGDEECPEGTAVATFTNWRYTPVAQFIAEDEAVAV